MSSPGPFASQHRGPNSAAVPLVIRDGQAHAGQRARPIHMLGIDLDVLTPAERRDLANSLLRAAWSAALPETRVLLLDLLIQIDDPAQGDTA
jgi:hypothetical protein